MLVDLQVQIGEGGLPLQVAIDHAASIGLDGPGAFALMIDEAAAYQRRFNSRIERIVFVGRDEREARAVRSLLQDVYSDWGGTRP